MEGNLLTKLLCGDAEESLIFGQLVLGNLEMCFLHFKENLVDQYTVVRHNITPTDHPLINEGLSC
mgnify:CR=1 FL=1